MALLLVYAHGFVAGNAVGNQLCIQLERQPSGAHAGFFQFFGKVFPRMDRDDCRHRVLAASSDSLKPILGDQSE